MRKAIKAIVLCHGLFGLTLGGCAGDVQTGEPTLGSASEALEGATVVLGAPGVVELSIGGSGCTGSMIAPNAVVTAAHCMKNLGSGVNAWSGTATAKIHYHDPNGGRRQVFSGTATWFAYPTYRDADEGAAQANSDMALIVTPTVFTETGYKDYLRIYSDIDGPLNKPLTVFGAGIYNDDGARDDLLRTSRYNVENVTSAHVKVDNSADVHVCHGDSGGPLIKYAKRAGVSVPTLVGDLSNGDSIGDAPCGTTFAWEDDAFYSRINGAKVAWIESTLGVSCPTASFSSDLIYKRCFPLPFIADLPGETLKPGVATAVLVAIGS